MNIPPPIIVDSTLREGNQSPLIRFDADVSCRIARGLWSLGIEEIEVGHPSASDAEFARVKAVVQLPGRPRVIAHARAVEADVRAVHATGAEAVGIFIGINPLSLESRLNGRTCREALRIISESVRLAKSLQLEVRLTVEDATRTDLPELLAAFQAAVDAGADRVCVADTVGCASPETIKVLVGAVTQRLPVPVEIHTHNDRGLAVANVLAAVRAGARFISCSMLGIGERAGIADTAVVLSNLHFESWRKLADPGRLQDLSREVELLTRTPHDPARPVTGKHVFHHTAHLHRAAAVRAAPSYCWLPPEELARQQHTELPAQLPVENYRLISSPAAGEATGQRFVILDELRVPDCRRSFTVQRISHASPPAPARTHDSDSCILLIGSCEGSAGLEAEVTLGSEKFTVASPASVFVPAGKDHSCRIIGGAGILIHYADGKDVPAALLPP